MFLTVNWRHERKNNVQVFGTWVCPRTTRSRSGLCYHIVICTTGGNKRVALPGDIIILGEEWSLREADRSPGLGGIGGNLEGSLVGQ